MVLGAFQMHEKVYRIAGREVGMKVHQSVHCE